MQTTFKILVSCLFCFVLPLLSGCGSSGSSAPILTPAEQAEVDKIIAEEGRDALRYYLEHWNPASGNTDEKLALKYVKYFVSQGANVNARDEDDYTPLHYAAALGSADMVKFLVSQGAIFNYVTEGKRGMDAPLHYAVLSGNTDMVKFLVSKGADINVKDGWGYTPLDIALGESTNRRVVVGTMRFFDSEERRKNRCAAIAKYLSSIGAKSGKDK